MNSVESTGEMLAVKYYGTSKEDPRDSDEI